MIIGVKYCGGCNPVYNRGRQVKRLQEQFPEHEFVIGDNKDCEIGLLVCGCVRACASAEGLKPKKKLFLLPTERSFSEVRTYLEGLRNHRDGQPEEEKTGADPECCKNATDMEKKKSTEKRTLIVGDTASVTKSFFKDDVDKFAALTGDFNPIHMDAEYAKQTEYKKPVVHGVLVGSLISTVMGMELPGPGTVLIEEKIRFLGPVFYGDTVQVKVEFTSYKELEDSYIGTFTGTCENQNHEIVVFAECRQSMKKDRFLIKEKEK